MILICIFIAILLLIIVIFIFCKCTSIHNKLTGSGKCSFNADKSETTDYTNCLKITNEGCKSLSSEVNISKSNYIEANEFTLNPPLHMVYTNDDNMDFSLYLTDSKSHKHKTGGPNKPKSNAYTYEYSSILMLNFYAFYYEYDTNKFASIYKFGEITTPYSPIELSEMMIHISNITKLNPQPQFYSKCLSINLGFENADISNKQVKNMGYLLDDLEDAGRLTINKILHSHHKGVQIHRQSDSRSEISWEERLKRKDFGRGDGEMYVVYDESKNTFINNCNKMIKNIPIEIQNKLNELNYDDVKMNCYDINLKKYKHYNKLSNIKFVK